MKLCWWTPGTSSYQTALVTALRALGVDVEVCYFHGKFGKYRLMLGWRDPELHPWEHYVRNLREARRAVPDFDERVQMVPSFFNLTSWKLILRSSFKGLPWFALTEGTNGRWMMRPLFRAFCWFVNRYALQLFVEGGRYTRRQFIDFGVREEKATQFGYATMRPPKDAKRIEHAGTTFVFAGEFCERKAVDVIAAAWKRLHAEYPSSRLVMAGGGALTGLFAGVAGVECVGTVRQEDVYGVILRGDVMLLPSRYDPWGVALVEGAMAGLAMVGSDRTGSADLLIEDGVNGYRVKAGDADDLLRVMRLYAADRALARSQGAAAARAAERTSGERLAKTLVERLAPLLKPRVAACFWEEHCTECGEPDCYRTCARYVRGRGGRCRRFAGGLDETILGEGVEAAFLPWGKMEAFFHGRMVSRDRAVALERLMVRTAGLRKLFPRWWRSWRWRRALVGARPGAPTVWRLRAVAERDERLTLQVVDRDLKELVRRGLDLRAGVPTEAAVRLPPVADGALFRIFPTDGEGTGRIRFERNWLAAEPSLERPVVKCLAWDLDGTLWQGTLADDGADGLTLNEAAVRLVKTLDARGVVNSVISRNDPALALAALKRLGVEEYFVFPQIGWGPKSEGLKNLARELNIGLDAIAFIDDREEVRGEVRANVPEVRVFAAEEMTGLDGLPEFNPPVSAESAGRRASYRAEMVRRGAAKAFGGDAAAFLAASGLELELLPVEGERIVRCRELVQRTNQLNLTGRRYGEADFAQLLASAACCAVHVWDRYGDYGIVGFVAVRGTHVVECCFSCRVAEKGVERRVLDRIAAGRKMTADRVATPRNGRMLEIVEAWLRGETA